MTAFLTCFFHILVRVLFRYLVYKKPKLIVDFETTILSVGDKRLDETHLKNGVFEKLLVISKMDIRRNEFFFHEICNSNSSL